MDDSNSVYSGVGSSMEFGSSTRGDSPLPDSPVGFSSSIRSFNPQPDIQNAFKQVQACIDSTSSQLRNDYKHRQAVYQSWCPPPTGLKSSQHTSPPGIRQQSSLLCSHGSSPRASISSLWAAGERIGMLLQQQKQEGQQAAGLGSGSSFADFFAARRSAATGSLDPARPATAGRSSIPIIQALAQDVRATAVRNTARPVSPLMMKCLLGNQVTTPLLLEKLRQQAAAQQDAASEGQLYPSSGSPPRSYGSSGTQGSQASCSAVGVHGGLSTGRGSSSVGELSLWGEPLNVSPVSPHRAAATGCPAGVVGRAGADQQDSRPPSPAVLSLLGTDHNIAPVVVAAVGEGCGPTVSPYNVARPCSASHDPKACCRTRSCSPTAYRAEGGSRAGSRSRSCSPHPKHLICCGCRRQHTLQQHSKCCHLCGNCCKSRGSCASKPHTYGSSTGAGQCLAGSSSPALAAAMQGPVSAEASGVSTSTTSTCPCIKAYRQGCRDTLQQANSAGSTSRLGTAGKAAAAAPHLSAVQQLPSSKDKSEAGLACRSPGEDASTLQDSSQAGYAPAAMQRAGRELSYHSRHPSAAQSTASRDDQQAATAGLENTAAAGMGSAAAAAAFIPEPEDLVRTAFLEVHAAQQNLINQGPAADARDVEELTLILQQVLPAAEPQHEFLLKEVLSRQQQLLALQDAYLAESEAYEEGTWPQVPPLRLPSELVGQRRGALAQGAPAPAEIHPSGPQQQGWEGQRPHSAHHAGMQDQQQRQGVSLDYEGASTRTPSTNSSTSSGSGSRPSVYVTPDNLAELMSKEDRLGAAAAAYEAFESSSGKPLQQVLQAGRGTAGSRSSRGRWASGASTVDANTGRPVHASAGGPQQQQDHAGGYVQHGQLGFEGGAPAYAVDSLEGSEMGLDEHSRPLVHYMLSQGGGGSRHVVQDAPSQVQEGRPASFSRAASSSSRMPQSGAGNTAGGSNVTANRTPSNRSIADSAWSVQVVPGAAAGSQQVQCNTAMHAAEAPEPAWASVGVQPAGDRTSGCAGGAGASDNGQGQGGPHSSRVSGASSAAAGVVPMLNLGGGALDTETAKLAGLAVDPRVLPGLTPRLRDEVEAAGSLQELAAAISRGGAGRQDSTDSRRSMQAGRGVDGRAQAPATPGRPGVGQAVGAFVEGQGSGSSAGGSAGGMQGLRSTSVRFQEASQASLHSPANKGLVNIGVGQLLEQPQQQWAAARQQFEHSKKSPTGRAGSFELPDSNPSTHENSYQSLDDIHDAAGYISSTQPGMPMPLKGQLVHTDSTSAAGVRAPGPQQSLTGVQQGVAVQQARPEQMLTPRAIALQQQQQQLRQSNSSLSSPSSLLDAAARARALTSGGGGSRHSTAGPLSPFSSRMALQSPRASLAAAAAAAAAVTSGGGSRVSRAASEVHSPRFASQETHLQPPAAAAAVESPRARSSAGTGSLPQQQQQQHVQAAEAQGGAGLTADASGSWRERQLAMQQELAAQQQQLARIRSRTSSVATTPAAPSMLRSVSRASDFGSIASSTAAPAARTVLDAQHRQSSQHQQRQSVQSASGAQQQQPQQPQQPLSQAQALQQQQPPLLPRHARGSSLHIEPSSVSTVSAANVREEASTPLHVLDAILCDALKQRARSRLMKQALQGWRQHTAGRKARAALRRAGSVDSRDCPIKQTQQQQDSQSPSPRPGSSHALRISLQGLNRNVLKQSLGQLLQGKLDEATSDTDSLEIVVSGQLRLQSSPSPRHRAYSPSPQQRQHVTSTGSNGSDGSLGSSTIRRFEQQLNATREAVAAAAERAGRAPLQGVLRDMQSMITRMEAACTAEGNGDAAAAAACGSPNRASPRQHYRHSPHHSPHAQHQQHMQSPQQQSKHYWSPTANSAARSRSPVPHMTASSPQHLTYSTSRRPGSAGSSLGEWQEPQSRGHSPRGASAGLLQPCASAFARNRSPRRQGQGPGSKVKSPDKHKLRGRLHWIQDQLAKLEIKMNQASAMSEPCSCNAAGCVHRLNLLPQQQAYWGRGEQKGQWGSGGACCCSLQGKRDVLVGRMQQELEELQVELMQLGTNLPGAYSSSNGC